MLELILGGGKSIDGIALGQQGGVKNLVGMETGEGTHLMEWQ